MVKELAVGNPVGWNSGAGRVKGVVVEPGARDVAPQRRSSPGATADVDDLHPRMVPVGEHLALDLCIEDLLIEADGLVHVGRERGNVVESGL
jgi:hypothetical protein